MFEIFDLYGIPAPIIDAIRAIYTESESCILTPDGMTDFFAITSGILQGDTLAPLLYIIVLDYVLRTSVDCLNDKGLEVEPRKSSHYPSKHVTNVDFADDLALMAESHSSAQALLSSLECAANSVGLYLNESKTEYVNINGNNPDPVIKSSSGKVLKCVEDFKYLGSFIMDSAKDFNTRKVMAWMACNRLDKIWRSELPNEIKIGIFQLSNLYSYTAPKPGLCLSVYTNALMELTPNCLDESKVYPGKITPPSKPSTGPCHLYHQHCDDDELSLLVTPSGLPTNCPQRLSSGSLPQPVVGVES